MNISYFTITVVLALVIIGATVVWFFARRNRSTRFHDQFGSEYDLTVKTMGG
jgi:Flp pilus assembly protein TadB